MNIKFLGCGAAGNKVAVDLMKEGFNTNSVFLINSTRKDIPEAYRNNALIFSSDGSLGGCGKEREMGKAMLIDSLQNGNIDLDTIPDPDTQIIVICASVEGGSGSASITVLAKYFKEVLKCNVALILLFGFEDDVRGMQNSIEVCQELSDQYTTLCISNKKFLQEAGGNKVKAEKLANVEVIKKLTILTGMSLRDAEQNIDDTDLYKLSTTENFMDIIYAPIDTRLKNLESYNKNIIDALDNTKSLDISNPSAKRIGAIFTITKKNEDFIDFSSEIVRTRYGVPYEYFTHIQYTEDENEQNVCFIIAGMDMPIDEIKDVYEKYKESTEKVKKTKDSFFNTIDMMKGKSEDSMFNLSSRKVSAPSNKDKKAFFSAFGTTSEEDGGKDAESKFKNTNVIDQF